jgi:hypothetical protein
MGLRRLLDPPEVRVRKRQLRAAGLHQGHGGLEVGLAIPIGYMARGGQSRCRDPCAHARRETTIFLPVCFLEFTFGVCVLSPEFFDRSSPIGVKGRTWVPSAGRFWCLQLKIHHDRLLAIPHHYGFARHIWISINLLMGHIRGNVNKISGSGFVIEFQSIAPAHPHSPFHHVQDGFQFSMVVRSRLRIRLDDHRPSPQRGRSGFRMSNCGGPRHARRLWRIHIQFVGMYDFDSVFRPVHKYTPKIAAGFLV